MAKADPPLQELDQALRERVQAWAPEGGKRSTKLSPFSIFLRANRAWFDEHHTGLSMTWEGWAAIFNAKGMRDIHGKRVTPRGLRAAYQRETKRPTTEAKPRTRRPAPVAEAPAAPPPPPVAPPAPTTAPAAHGLRFAKGVRPTTTEGTKDNG